MARNGVGLAPVAFDPRAEVYELVRGQVNVHEVQGGVFMADAVVQFSGGQPFGALFPGRQEELPELFRAEGQRFMVAAHGVEGDAFFLQHLVEFLALGESVDGGASFNVRHVPHLDDHVHLVLQDFPIEGFDEVDGYPFASFHAFGGVMRVADDGDSPRSGFLRVHRLKQKDEK